MEKKEMMGIEYWDMFAKDPKAGMTFEEFENGYRLSDKEISDDEIKAIFHIWGDIGTSV